MTRGRRYAFLPFVYDEGGAAIRAANLRSTQRPKSPATAQNSASTVAGGIDAQASEAVLKPVPKPTILLQNSHPLPRETAEIVEYIRGRIAAAEVELDPFPHFVTTDLLPDAEYDEIIANWPPQELANTTNWAARRELEVAPHLHEFPETIRPTWQKVVEWTQVARDLVYEKLQPYLADKVVPLLGRRRAAEMTLVTQRGPAVFLATYTGALSLVTHVDHALLVTNSFLYGNERSVEEPDLGTVLYQSYGLALPSNRIALPEPVKERYLRRAKTVPYRRNSLLSYVNTPSAFHGVDATDIGSRVRRLLMFGTLIDPQAFKPEESQRLFVGAR